MRAHHGKLGNETGDLQVFSFNAVSRHNDASLTNYILLIPQVSVKNQNELYPAGFYAIIVGKNDKEG